MGHCGGGDGPNVFDTVGPLEHWVEQGKAPDSLIASQVAPLITGKNLDLKKLAAGDSADGDENVSAPWHFKLLMVMLVLYLTWRIVQLFV